MTYKTILVHVDHSKHCADRVRAAAALAIAEDAHLVGAAVTGISRLIFETGMLVSDDPGLAERIKFFEERARRSLNEFEALAQKLTVPSIEKRLVDDEALGGISLQARYADLVVLSQTDLEDASSPVLPDFPEYVVIHSGRPVLILPYAGRVDNFGKKALVAWDGSAEATHAVTNALPMLKRAQLVQVAVFNPRTQFDVHGEQPGADIALYLARHGIKIEVIEQDTGGNIGDALLSLAADKGSDLIVMGGYGHSRFRELMLGGVTRTVLESMTVPVLMSH
jgi:nucleotide-binding universal stress UspA family protein